MKTMIFPSNISVNELKELTVFPETWMKSQVSQVEEAESIEQKYSGVLFRLANSLHNASAIVKYSNVYISRFFGGKKRYDLKFGVKGIF